MQHFLRREPGQRSLLVKSSLSELYRLLLLREDFKPGQRSLVKSSLSCLYRLLCNKGGF